MASEEECKDDHDEESNDDEESEESKIKQSQLLSIHEINSDCLLYEDRSIRTWGKIISHDIHAQHAVIMNDAEEKLCVDTAKIEPYGFTLGFYYNLIGDMVKNEDTFTLRVRVATCINELDFDLFEKALELRRKFLEEDVT